MNQFLQLFLFIFFTLGISFSGYAQAQGDTLEIDGSSYKLVSDNMITNPGFESGFTGWTDATTSAAELTSTKFTVVASGGIDGSKYLVGTTNESSGAEGSIGTGWGIEANKMYCFLYHVKYLDASATAASEQWLKVSLTNDKTSSAEPELLINSTEVNGGGEWTQNSVVFTNTTPYNYIVARFRWLGNRLGFDAFSLFEITEIPNTVALENAIAEAEALYDSGAQGASGLQAAIDSAKTVLSNGTAEEVKQAVTDLRNAILTFQLQNASPGSPMDMTGYITNPGFDENQPDGWKGIGMIKYNCVEFYQKTFNMYQKLVGLPTGKYRLKAQGFERPKNNDSGAAYQAGTEVIYARIYAKSNSFAGNTDTLNSLYQHEYTGTGSLNGYVNSMSSAQTVMKASDDNYHMQLDGIMLNEGDTLVFGAKSDFQQNYSWVLLDHFRLEYLGAYDTTDLVSALKGQIRIAQDLLSEKMQQTASDTLTKAIAYAQQTISAQPLVYDDLYSTNQAINTTIEAAKTSIHAYVNLQTAIEEGAVEIELISGTKKANLQTAIDEAKLVVVDLNATLEAIITATGNINSIIKKQIYIPTWKMGDVNDPNNNWSMERSKQSKNWIIFWEPQYGQDPSVVADDSYRINIDRLLEIAESAYKFYTDSLKFIAHDGVKSSKYKMIICLRYTRDWEATGSGVDDVIGLLTLTAWSAQVAGHTMAHEVGHCFQYQVHCDNNDKDGWMYGFGSNGSGGNCWWEQCAQWQGYKIYPSEQFTSTNFSDYLSSAHKHILHEAPRYSNYFIQDFWAYKHGINIIGRLWNESKYPEDPVETYKRITSISQSQFNDEMFECASRFATWDIPTLKSYGASKIQVRPQTTMESVSNNYWQVDGAVCPENYGYNVIKLNAPSTDERVRVYFQGKTDLSGYRNNHSTYAGWRYGFVALLKDGTRVYSDMGSASYSSPNGTLHFDCPSNTSQLWLVVTGAPLSHWHHAWDEDDTNDEQWPYQVKFNNTNLYGYNNVVTPVSDVANATKSCIQLYTAEKVLIVSQIPDNAKISVYDIMGKAILCETVSQSVFEKPLTTGIYIVIIQTESENYSQKVWIQ
jgi:hypothetical protein